MIYQHTLTALFAQGAGTRPRLVVGCALSLLSAMFFALNVVCVSIVFEHGGNVHAVNVIRPWFFLICLALISVLRGSPRSLPRRQRYFSFLLGLLLCVEMYAVHSAIGYIPVGLAILVMYTYPIIVTLISGLAGKQRLGINLFVAMLVVFAGLALALQAPVHGIDWRGVGLAAIAALGMTLLVTISETTMHGQNRVNVMLHANLAATVVMTLIVVSGAPLVWPHDGIGMLALTSATLLYVLATFLLFLAISMVGPVRFAVIDNTSPIWAILFGFVLLGESLSPLQSFGAALVVCGVIAVQLLYRTEATSPH